jgi:signal transduction histidine kinase/ActR/RegA family two-component response regulator
VSSRDELGELADAFNTMTTTLGEREEELRRVNLSLEQKVRERTAELELNQSQLITANVELERASRLKSEFLANMSHELRTPLNAVNGFSELLLEETYGPLLPKQRRYVDNVLASGKHLLQLINDILDLSKIEAGRMDVRQEEFSLRQAIESAASVIQPLAQKKGLAVEVTVEDGLDHLRLDPGKTKQILYNLMSNAVKFTDNGGIQISAARPLAAPQWVEIVVADTGIGIRPDDQVRIFREFEQVDGSHARRYEGTGLGLALSKRLAEAMGGALHVESKVGTGTTFAVELATAESPNTPLAADEPRANGLAPETRGTILYIEDNLANLRLFERIIARRPGVTLLSAMQGRRGLDLARAHRPAAVVLDLHLPDMAGHEVLASLRAAPETREIPVVILSADATPGQTARLLANGADAYLTKPVNVAELLSLVDRMLAQTGEEA